MPRFKRKIEKLDEYVPLDADDLRRAVEIPVKQIKDEELIKIESGSKKTKIGKLKTRTIREEI